MCNTFELFIGFGFNVYNCNGYQFNAPSHFEFLHFYFGQSSHTIVKKLYLKRHHESQFASSKGTRLHDVVEREWCSIGTEMAAKLLIEEAGCNEVPD
ncbi:hypothetical protein VNO77_03905 [Canavalia gladiata]|uniref:Uncharacterized protein n=1 Tax=Canavalia gladiata TaxID=3824 RepID=A0AAN9R799_CANGL